jgi:Cd2+/Zn2+-exporting ATPase
MAHDHIKHSVESETGRASALLIATLLGGTLLLCSFAAKWFFANEFYSGILAFVSAILLGIPLIWHAAYHLYMGHSHMDELVALAIVAAFAIGEYLEAGVIGFFLILANLIETRTALGARASIESLIRLTPTQAHRVVDNQEEIVDTKNLRPGDIVRVRPGDNIPADGVVILGESSINQATITGESLPVDKAVTDTVFSGTTNLTGALDIEVTKAGSETTLGRVQSLILEAEGTRIPLMRLIDQYAGWYTPTIVMVAAVVLFFTHDLNRTIAMLVVACPCALVLATPTAMVAALSCAARLGILIKNVADLEHARNLTAAVFDKTGTLTTGLLSVTRMKPAPGVDGAELLHAAASAEMLSKHPAAKAVVNVAQQARLTPARPSTFEEVSGRGVIASVNGHEIRVGRSTWLAEQGQDMSLLSDPDFQEEDDLSMLYVTRGGKCIGWIGLEDKTRPDARAAIDSLRELGIKQLIMVTGDRWSVARRVAGEMGCTDVQAEVLPAQKLKLVDQLKAKGHRTVVIGDGVNDAPALVAGDLGIAMGAAGSDVAINSASIALMNNDLNRLPFLVRLSRQATMVIWQNLVFGILFIVSLEVLAVMGMLEAMVAAFLHTVSSAIVIFNSARLVRFGENLETSKPIGREDTNPVEQEIIMPEPVPA